MSAKATKVARCKECLVYGVWRYDDETGECIGKHDCTEVTTPPSQRRDQALDAVTEARPAAVRAGVRVIADYAVGHETFSANDVRVDMDVARVEGPAVGAAFGQAVRDGLIRRDGYVRSTKANTNGHDIKQWRSLIYRPAVAS